MEDGRNGQSLEYIEGKLRGLSEMAAKEGYPMLAYLIDMAQMEAMQTRVAAKDWPAGRYPSQNLAGEPDG